MELWSHQKQAIELGKIHNQYAFLHEAGTGKTRTMIEVLRHIYTRHNRGLRTLVLCPQIVCGNWVSEILKFSKIQKCNILNLGPIKGAKRVKLLKEFSGYIVIVNYEAFRTDAFYDETQRWSPEVLVCDESHRLKSKKAKVSQQVQQLADRIHYKYILSGTPMTNSIEDIWQQFRILDQGETFGKNFWAFRAKWLYDENERWKGKHKYFPSWKPRTELFPEFSIRMGRKSMVVKKDECMDLPPLVRGEIKIGMSKKQQKIYNEMKTNFITFVESMEESGKPKAAIAQLALTKALRLQQISSGFVRLDDDTDHTIEDCPRPKALKELLVDLVPEHKVIVWSVFKNNYATIRKVCEDLKIEYTELHGEVPSKDRDSNIEKFNTDESCRVLIGNQGAGGIGVNLTAASHMIYYSKGFSLEHDIQSQARNYRGGSEVHKKITRIDLVAENTIDEVVNKALKNKEDIANAILEWRKL